MFGGGAPIGNQNAAKAKLFEHKLRLCLAQNDYQRLRDIAEQACKQAESGEQWAIQFVAERIDGKVRQIIEHAGNDEKPLTVHVQESLELTEKIRGLLQSAAELVVAGTEESDRALLGTGQEQSTTTRVRPSQRPNNRLPTRQVVVKGDKLADYQGSVEQLEP